jgi:hypothetical protein
MNPWAQWWSDLALYLTGVFVTAAVAAAIAILIADAAQRNSAKEKQDAD